ncbi:MAG: lipoate--protein ligase family protein [Candidatus Krumholzibacteriota bacterium]|nr:lipoate--protein ligase family protein [Candidatus Krumholzibacteriota bacterium]
MNRWYLLDDPPSTGAANMAVDEYLLDNRGKWGKCPVLRLYSFDPPAITVGFHQDIARVVDLEAARRGRVDVLKRITGGRALLHDGELTYSVTAPLGGVFFPAGLQETFLGISYAIVDAIRLFGVEARISGGRSFKRDKEGVSPCLVSTSRHEITAGGRKIVGSAQRRRSGSFLQHGSVLLGPGSERIVEYLPGDLPPLDSVVTNIEEETGRRPARGDFAAAMIDAFRKRFEIVFEPLVFSEEDIRVIASMTEKKATGSLSPAGSGV